MVLSWTKCIQLLLVVTLNVSNSVRSSTLNNSSSKDSSSGAVFSVLRGVHQVPDRLNVCSPEVKRLRTFTDSVQATKTMNCSTEVTGCSEGTGWKASHCSCKPRSPNYVASERKCVSNGWLRTGCAFSFGSWQFSTGWRWTDGDDPLLSLYIEDGYGITGGFNASMKKYESCSLVNITVLNKHGNWQPFDYEPETIKFFKLRGYFHVSWVTTKMRPESKQKLTGRLGQFLVSCETPDVLIDGDSVKPPQVFSSCLPFKVTGNLTYSDRQGSKEGHSGGINAVAIALGVIFPLLFIVALLAAVWFYRRKYGNHCKLPFPRNCFRKT